MEYGYSASESFSDEVQISSLSDLEGLNFDDRWVFRGQSSFEFGLLPALERCCSAVDPKAPSDYIRKIEAFTLTEFQSRAHHYYDDPPAVSETFEWLALMQHHGVPTRLLDFSQSPFVALFFALCDLRAQPIVDAALWALNADQVRLKSQRMLGGVPYPFPNLGAREVSRMVNELLKEDRDDGGVILASPFRMNDRLSRQQGLFLFALGSTPLSAALTGIVSSPRSLRSIVRKFRVPLTQKPTLWKDLLTKLERMNLSHESLFSGLDYFARSLDLRSRLSADRLFEPRVSK